MKKSVTEMLKVFAANPIESEKVFCGKKRRWNLDDTKQFWYNAMVAHPDDDLKATAERLISFLSENDLIWYDCILSDYFDLFEGYYYDCDIDLKSHTIDYIAREYAWFLDDAKGDEADELREAVKTAEKVWYWHELMTYCVEAVNMECGFVERVVREAKSRI